MEIKKIVIGLFALSSILTFGFAEDLRTLTVDEAVQLAKENNISIKVAQNTLKNLETVNKYSWNSVAPTASLKGDFVDNFEGDYTSVGLSGSVSMGLSANLYSSIQSAKLNYQKGLLSYNQAVRSIERSVRKSFYQIIYEQENLALQKRNLSTSREQYENNKEKFKNGKISELDAFTSQVNYETKKPKVESAEIALENELAAFKQILGLGQDEKIQLKGSLDEILNLKPIKLEDLAAGEKSAPEVQSAEYDVDIAKNSLLGSRFSAYGPTVTGSYSYGKSKRSTASEATTTNQLSVGVTVPLDGALPWSAKAATVAANKNALDTAQMKLENTKTSVAVQTESYVRKINLAVSQISSLKATEKLAQETYQMRKTAYNYGKTDLLTLQNASDSVLSASVELKNQAYSLISSILDLEDVLGLEFGTLSK